MEERLILVTNDDGYDSRGMEAAVEVARTFGRVVVVAPETTQSGMSQAITMYSPLYLRSVREEEGLAVYAFSGTPVDCVKMAFDCLLRDERVDLVLSGINHGSNSAINVLYSGTMGAAIEGGFYDIPSIGFSLLNVGATSFGGGSGAKDFGSWQNLTLGLISLVACLAFQLLMKGTAKQLSVLFGLVVGYVAAICMGKVDFSGFQNLAIVSVPQFMPFKPEFDWGSIISIGLLYVVSSVEVLGDTAALTKVGLNRTPTERETAGAIAGDGLISTVSGLFGCLPLTSFAQNIGLVAMTKVVNRKVILSGGLILVLASFVPAIAEVFNSLPQAVLGGCTIMMFGNIILSGFQMIAEAGFTQRNITIAALSLTIGIGFTQVSDIFTQFPALFQQIFASNCIAVAFVVAVILNTVLPSEEHFLSAPKEAPAADAE